MMAAAAELMPPRPVVVIGAGNAAGYIAREAVALGRAADLRILGREAVAPYERPALSKAYLAPTSPARLPGFHTCVGGGGERQDPAWYAGKGVDLRLGATVEKIDAVAKTVTWREAAGGPLRTAAFERLVLATGARPVSLASDFGTPGADLPGVHVLREVADADSLLAAVAAAAAGRAGGGGEARPPAEVLVVGGGYIGVEACANLSAHPGVRVTMVLPEPSVLARVVPPALASFYERQLQARGVVLVKGRTAVAFEPSADDPNRVGFAVLSDAGPKGKGQSRLPCDVVLVGAGARPNVSLAADAGLALAPAPPSGPGGVQVDGSLRSVSHPSVYAVGDVAAFPLRRLTAGPAETSVALARQEHVAFARASAAHAAQAAFSASGEHPSAEAIPYLPYFYSRTYDNGWVFYGEAPAGADGGEVVLFGPDDPATAAAPGKAKFGAYWVAPRAGREGERCVVGAFLEGGDAAENEAVRQAVASGAPLPAEGGVAELARLGAGFAVAYAAKL